MAEFWHKTKGAGGSGLELRRFIPPILLLFALGALVASGATRFLSFDAIVDGHEQFRAFVNANRFVALALFTVVYVGAVTLSLPVAAFMSALGGFLFGWRLGALIAVFSATLGGTCLFLILKSSLGEFFRRRAGTRLQALATGFRRNAFFYILFLRVVTLVPSWLVNWASAFFGVRLGTFVAATTIGMVPPALAFAIAGSSLDEILLKQKRLHEACLAAGGGDCQELRLGIGDLVTPETLIALSLLGILALLPILIKRFLRARAKAHGGSLS